MSDSEFLKHLPGIAYWVFGSVIFVGVILTRLAQGKKDFAELFGRPGRWLYRRAESAAIHSKEVRQREFMESFDTPVYETLNKRIAVLEELVKNLQDGAIRDAIRIQKLELVEEVHAARIDMDSEFIREDAEWHIDASVWAVEKRTRLPRHRTYRQFVREYKARSLKSKKERERE